MLAKARKNRLFHLLSRLCGHLGLENADHVGAVCESGLSDASEVQERDQTNSILGSGSILENLN